MSSKTQASDAKLIHFGQTEVEAVVKDDQVNIVEGNPVQKVWLFSNDQQTGSRHGMWDCTAGKFKVKMNGYTEFCHILEGEAEITNLADGSVTSVKAGDSFVMESGYDTQWHVPTYIKKSFVISDLVG
mgnify:CR=1 FL=1